jgi:hypothetical protein
MIKPVKTAAAQTTGEPWLLRPAKAGNHDLSWNWYVVEEASTIVGQYQAGTHDGLRDGASSGRVTGRMRSYYKASDWLAAGRPLPAAHFPVSDEDMADIKAGVARFPRRTA